MNKLLDWALKKRKEEAKKELVKRILENKALGQQNEDQINPYANHVIEWLFNTDHTQPLQSLFENNPKKPSQELIDQFNQTALQILMQKKEDFKNKLLILAKESYVPDAAEQQNAHQQIALCSDKVLLWLFNSDHKQVPDTLFANEPNPPSEKLINSVLQSTFQILANEKIDTYKDKANLILQNKLPAILEETIYDNAKRLTNELMDRVAEVIDHMGDEQFTVLFDKIIEITSKHVTNVTESHEQAEEAVRKHRELKKLALSITKIGPKNGNEKVVEKCEEYLANLKKRGGISWELKKTCFLKPFLSSAAIRFPA